MMKHILLTFSILSCLALSMSAQAREVTFTTQLARYSGSGAYFAIYLLDANNKYQQTIWVAGKKRKYYSHLRGWSRASGKRAVEYDGKTGASVTSGRSLTISQNIDDSLIDSGYKIVIDSAVEDANSNQADVSTPLTTAGAGKAVVGSGYVMSFTYDFK